MEVLQKILTVLFVINCLFLILLILLQSSRSSGMSLFGGGGSQSAFGSSSGNVLTKATAVMTTIFLFLGLTIAWLGTSDNSKIRELEKEFVQESPIEASSNLEDQGEENIKPDEKKEASPDSPIPAKESKK